MEKILLRITHCLEKSFSNWGPWGFSSLCYEEMFDVFSMIIFMEHLDDYLITEYSLDVTKKSLLNSKSQFFSCFLLEVL